MKFLCLLIFLSAFEVHAQTTNIETRGSFILGAVGSDGIILAADSRGALYRRSFSVDSVLAFHDLMQKLFIVGKNAISFQGKASFGGHHFASIINLYKNSPEYDTSISNLIPSLQAFCKRIMQPSLYRDFMKDKIIAGGYHLGRPMVLYYEGYDAGVKYTLKFAQTDSSLFNSLYNTKGRNCKQLAKFSKTAIKKYAKEYGQTLTIGGPIRIIKIDSIGARWIRNEPKKPPYTDTELISKHLNREIKLTYTKQEYRNTLDSMFRQYAPHLYKKD